MRMHCLRQCIFTSFLGLFLSVAIPAGSFAYDLLLSDSPDRSGAVLLDGATVSGSMYVFAGPESGVTRVSFFIDDPQMNGLPTKVENLAPYDLGDRQQPAGPAIQQCAAGRRRAQPDRPAGTQRRQQRGPCCRV